MERPAGEQREQLIENLAQRISRWNLATPAIMLLEVVKPFSFIAGQGLLLCEPFLGFFFVGPQVGDYADLLADRANVDHLVARLEAGQAGPSGDNGI